MWPWTPAEFRAIIAPPTGNLCSKLVALILKMPALLLQAVDFAINPDGSASDALKAWIGVASGSSLSPPSNVTAIGSGTNITFSWSAVTGATSYDVYISTTPVPPTLDPANAAATGVSGTSFVFDSSVASVPPFAVGTRFYGWIVARNSSTSSGYSAPANAIAGSDFVSPVTFGFGSGVEQSFIAPVNGNYDFALFAGGGGGGSSYSGNTFGNTPGDYAGGGGGGGGSKWTITLALLAGDEVLIDVGSGGPGGPVSPRSGSQPGTSGGDTFITKSGVEQARAKGGGGGGGALSPTAGAAGAVGSGLSGSGTIGNAGVAGSTDGGGAGGAALAGGTGKGGQGGPPVTATTTQTPGYLPGFAGEAGRVIVTF